MNNTIRHIACRNEQEMCDEQKLNLTEMWKKQLNVLCWFFSLKCDIYRVCKRFVYSMTIRSKEVRNKLFLLHLDLLRLAYSQSLFLSLSLDLSVWVDFFFGVSKYIPYQMHWNTISFVYILNSNRVISCCFNFLKSFPENSKESKWKPVL